MAKFVLLLFTLSLTPAFGQQKKLEKFFEKDYRQIPASAAYPTNETDPKVQIVPSVCQLNDTSGLVFNNEYVLFRQEGMDYSSQKDKNYRFVHTPATTAGEYKEFQNWVRDSIYRTKLYQNFEYDEEAAKMLLIDHSTIEAVSKSDKYKDQGYQFDDSKRAENLENYWLNWNYPLDPESKDQYYYFSEWTVPYIERYYHIREFDERKAIYESYFIHKSADGRRVVQDQTATLVNPYVWSLSSTSRQDEKAIIGQTYMTYFQDQPVIGINGMQARAFCHWKQTQLQQELSKENIRCFVSVSLPTISDLEQGDLQNGIQIQSKDYTEQWKITVSEYAGFLHAVSDSMALEQLYQTIKSDDDAVKLIQFDADYFYHPYNIEMMDASPENREENRIFFSLNYNPSILKKYKTEFETFKKNQKEATYVYYWINAALRGVTGEMEEDRKNSFVERHPEICFLKLKRPTDPKERLVGMDLSLGMINILLQNTGVRSHEDYARFIEKEEVNITPTIPLENQSEDDLVKGITYEQALAYYNWKNPIWKSGKGDDWQNFTFPAQEQFKAVQNGENVTVPEHQLPFPAPTFHYVVHVVLLN